MMFRGFLRWCAAPPEYRNLIDRDVGKSPVILESLPPVEKRTDALELAQVSPWWDALPRVKGAHGILNPYVFASCAKTGRLADPRSAHKRALKEAGIKRLTIHGLRRSYALLGEVAGATAQAMGHRPSAVHEGYKPRSVDALRPFLERLVLTVL